MMTLETPSNNSAKGLKNALRRSGSLSTREVEEATVREYVCKVLFPKIKFVQREHLYQDGMISKMLRKHLSYSKKDWTVVWDGWARKAIHKTVNEWRNALTQSVGNSVI